jgi:cephalosporin hydroxylase
MAYHGYTKFIAEYAKVLFDIDNSPIKILEVGVDTGITLFSIANNMNMLNTPFDYTGIDVRIQTHIPVMGYSFYYHPDSKIKLYEENSFDYLARTDEKFDIILIDGDHNYETVKEECKYLYRMMKTENSLFIFDDYLGRHSTKDMFYSDRNEQKDSTLLKIKNTNYKKQGVRPAVDEFVEHNELILFQIYKGAEPVVLVTKNNNTINFETV